MNYSPKCEETQGFSSTFRSFHTALANDLINRYGLYNKSVLEIGSGKGEFISMLCALGNNRGIAFDPAFVPARKPEEGGDAVEFIQDFYSEKYKHVKADFVVCKMTLEHIPNTLEFLRVVRQSMADRFETTLFFQVPNMARVLKDIAFWDIYHEHCSYFTATSLKNLFVMADFDILDTWTGYDDQYLMITARPAMPTDRRVNKTIPPNDEECESVSTFAIEVQRRIRQWQDMVGRLKHDGKLVVIWGSGSKGVAFLSALQADADQSAIEYAVDINPYRKGCFMPGTGQEIVEPAFLSAYRPDVVVAMNSIYTQEISSELKSHGLDATVLPIEAIQTAV